MLPETSIARITVLSSEGNDRIADGRDRGHDRKQHPGQEEQWGQVPAPGAALPQSKANQPQTADADRLRLAATQQPPVRKDQHRREQQQPQGLRPQEAHEPLPP
jgi:hypothetical protein